MPPKSKYVLLVDNISSSTPLRDIEREFNYFGRIRDCVKDNKARCALVEFEKSLDCSAAWRKMDGFRMDSRAWKVDYATRDDFKFFGWKWFEHSPSPPPRSSYRSRSRSRSVSRGRSRTPDTPYGKDGRRAASKSTSPPSRKPSNKASSPSRSRSRSASPRRDSDADKDRDAPQQHHD